MEFYVRWVLMLQSLALLHLFGFSSLCVPSSSSGVMESSRPNGDSGRGSCFMQTHSLRQAKEMIDESSPVGARGPSVSGSSFHEVVGNDGALMIVLERIAGRSALAKQELARVGINATVFPATDGSQTSPDILSQACRLVSTDKPRCGDSGCRNTIVQSIAHSHQRALQKAMETKEDWTAIFEDDAVPVLPEGVDWDAEFRNAWKRLPATAKVVRLGWCQPWWAAVINAEPPEQEGHKFHWLQFPHTSRWATNQETPVGGCTHAYIVHKSIIPSMLSVFPCCCGVDCCWEYGFFTKQDPAILANLIVTGGDWYISDHGGNGIQGLSFRGVIMQATEQLGHTYDIYEGSPHHTSKAEKTNFIRSLVSKRKQRANKSRISSRKRTHSIKIPKRSREAHSIIIRAAVEAKLNEKILGEMSSGTWQGDDTPQRNRNHS